MRIKRISDETRYADQPKWRGKWWWWENDATISAYFFWIICVFSKYCFLYVLVESWVKMGMIRGPSVNNLKRSAGGCGIIPSEKRSFELNIMAYDITKHTHTHVIYYIYIIIMITDNAMYKVWREVIYKVMWMKKKNKVKWRERWKEKCYWLTCWWGMARKNMGCTRECNKRSITITMMYQ